MRMTSDIGDKPEKVTSINLSDPAFFCARRTGMMDVTFFSLGGVPSRPADRAGRCSEFGSRSHVAGMDGDGRVVAASDDGSRSSPALKAPEAIGGEISMTILGISSVQGVATACR
jgi:hypothetical protein